MESAKARLNESTGVISRSGEVSFDSSFSFASTGPEITQNILLSQPIAFIDSEAVIK